jgi:hypothetical protein
MTASQQVHESANVAAVAAMAGLLGAHAQQQNSGPAGTLQTEFVKMADAVVDGVYSSASSHAFTTQNEAVWNDSGPPTPSFPRIVRPLSSLELVLANSCYFCAPELASVDIRGRCLRMTLALFLSTFWSLPALVTMCDEQKSMFEHHFDNRDDAGESRSATDLMEEDSRHFLRMIHALRQREMQPPLDEQLSQKANQDSQRRAGKMVGVILQQVQYSTDLVKREMLQQICSHARTLHYAIRFHPTIKCCVERVFVSNGNTMAKEEKLLPGQTARQKALSSTTKPVARNQISWKPEAHSADQVQQWLQTCYISAAVCLEAISQSVTNLKHEVPTLIETVSYFNFCRVALPQMQVLYGRIHEVCSNPNDMSVFVTMLGNLPTVNSILFPPGVVSHEEVLSSDASEVEEKATVATNRTRKGGEEGAAMEDEDIDFISSPVFAGAKRNFVFKLGGLGLGYYKDDIAVDSVPHTNMPAEPPSWPAPEVTTANRSYSMSPVDLLAASRANTYLDFVYTVLKGGPSVLEKMKQQSLLSQYETSMGDKLAPLIFVGMRSTVHDFHEFSHVLILSLVVYGVEQEQYGVPLKRTTRGCGGVSVSTRATRHQMLPYVLKEALRLFPETTTAEQISVLYGSIFKSLADDNNSQALALYAIQQLVKRVFELSESGTS